MVLGAVREVLLAIRTVAEMIEAFADEERCPLGGSLGVAQGTGLPDVRARTNERPIFVA